MNAIVAIVGLPSFFIINRFLEDTCVVVTVGFLLSRGSLLTRLFDAKRSRNDQFVLTLVFGLIGASDFLFPGDRYPYVPYTLAAAFAGYAGGLPIALLSSGLLILIDGVAVYASPVSFPLAVYAPSVLAAGIIGAATAFAWQWRKRLSEGSHWRLAVLLLGAFAAGALAEAFHGLMEFIMRGAPAANGTLPPALAPDIIAGCVAANGFGCLLLALVLQDAHERLLAQQLLVRTERELAALRMSQLDELQARLHPHFLFNALAAIAGLCVVDSRHARQAITDLATLLRQFLRSDPSATIPLTDELATVNTYLSIEKLRLGDRVEVSEEIPSDLLMTQVPRFSLQVLAENAIQHGIAEMDKVGQVRITARRGRRFLMLAVCDNGSGRIGAAARKRSQRISDSPLHGLDMLAARLRLSYGDKARVRLFRFSDQGTVCAIRIPVTPLQSGSMNGKPVVAIPSHRR